MATLKFIQTYLDDLLCISKDDQDDHIAKLQKVLNRLRNAGLNVNAFKSCVCAMKTEYLGYIQSRGGTKPQPKKVQAFLTLTPPQNVKQLCRFLGMVQYCRDIWARHSEVLAQLSDLVGECRQTKIERLTRERKSHGTGMLSISNHLTL